MEDIFPTAAKLKEKEVRVHLPVNSTLNVKSMSIECGTTKEMPDAICKSEVSSFLTFAPPVSIVVLTKVTIEWRSIL